MTIEIHTPELAQLMQDEIRRGSFKNVDDLLTHALHALREKSTSAQPEHTTSKRLIDVLTAAPFAGSELLIERSQEYPRSIEL